MNITDNFLFTVSFISECNAQNTCPSGSKGAPGEGGLDG